MTPTLAQVRLSLGCVQPQELRCPDILLFSAFVLG